MEKLSDQCKYFDLAANLSHSQYKGYYSKQKFHKPDLQQVIQRAEKVGCVKMLVSASNLRDCTECSEIALQNKNLYSTIGTHPAKINEVDNYENYFEKLDNLVQKYKAKVVAIGECGLDYDRLFCSDKNLQLKYFPCHFQLSEKYHLPMYFHTRNSSKDFFALVKENRHRFTKGIVHSFTGDLDDIKIALSLDLHFSINGLAFKEQQNYDIIRQIPIDRLMLETDAPYCNIGPNCDGYKFIKTFFPEIKKEQYNPDKMVKRRNEPCTIKQVSEALAEVLQRKEEEIAKICYNNSLNFFQLKE